MDGLPPGTQRTATLNRCAVLLLCSIVIIGGCSTENTDPIPPQPTIKLYVFDCGKIRLTDTEIFSVSKDETDVRDLITPCYVIEHDNGRLLWDGGLASSTADVAGWQGDRIQLRLDRTLNDQLGDVGLDLSSFDYFAFSHMHSDHVGIANEVDGATLLIQQAEYDHYFADDIEGLGIDTSLYENLRTVNKVFLNGDHDVFGDNRVRIISAPGHTPGHQVLLVDLTTTGPILIAGDLYHFALSRIERRVPTFNFDAEMTLASMDHIEALVKETGATLWIEHELAVFEQLRHAPAYYD